MPRVHYVKSARKDNPAAKKGEPYYWWAFRYGGKRYSKTPPRASQLTQSEYLSSVYALQEEIHDAEPEDLQTLEELKDSWVEQAREIGDECRCRFDSMPENFQYGETGELLERRAEAMDMWADEMEDINIIQTDELGTEGDDAEDVGEEEDYLQMKLEEIQAIQPEIE